jgi:hypothetical protein
LARIFGVVAVFVVTTVAWMVLGGVTDSRSRAQAALLAGPVAELWGSPQEQAAPVLMVEWDETVMDVKEITDAAGKVVSRTQVPRIERRVAPVDPASTRLDVDLHLDERRKGLTWFPLYAVAFEGGWTYAHRGPPRELRVSFQFPDREGVYDGFRFLVDGRDLGSEVRPAEGLVTTLVPVVDGQVVTLGVSYESRGSTTWTYRPTAGVGQVEDFQLSMSTDFGAIDFPSRTLSPTQKARSGSGWDLAWQFDRLVSGNGMGMVMPGRVQPGELASMLSLTAPLPLGLFFLWVYVLGLLRKIELHPMNYVFVAAAFFAFNLLLAYTADHLPIEWAFALASVVSLGLVASYLRIVVGARFAVVESGLAQLLYQVGFGVAHFYEGFTGLAITALGIVTLFLLMQLTGRVRWSEALGSAPATIPAK